MIKRINFCAYFTRWMVGFVNTSNQTVQTGRHGRHRPAKPLLGSVLLAAGLLASSSARATQVTYEGFAYVPTGPLSIDGQGGGIGWDASWGQFLGGATSYIITNGSL